MDGAPLALVPDIACWVSNAKKTVRPLLGLFVGDVQIWSNGSLVDLLGSLVCILKIELFIELNV